MTINLKNKAEIIAKYGKNAGQSFWGCPNYPACRGIINERWNNNYRMS